MQMTDAWMHVSKQGLQGMSATVTTRSRAPRGPYHALTCGPNSAVTGVPSAPAMCIGPLSLQRRTLDSAIIAIISRSERDSLGISFRV